MNPQLDTLKSQILSLNREDREKVVQFAIDSLEDEEDPFDRPGAPKGPTIEEARRRTQEMLDGKTQGIPGGEMMARLNAKYGR